MALEVLYDYLDGLAALPHAEWADERRACSPRSSTPSASPYLDPGGPTGVSDGHRRSSQPRSLRGLALLPRAAALLPTMRNAAQRGAEGQLRSHAVAREGREQLEQWAHGAAIGSDLAWPEFAAGAAASVLAVHALIVAAADARTTALAAREIDRAYLMISAISTMLDSVNDYQRDLETGRPRAVDWYDAADPAQQDREPHRRALTCNAHPPWGAPCDGRGGRDRLLHLAAGGARRACSCGRKTGAARSSRDPLANAWGDARMAPRQAPAGASSTSGHRGVRGGSLR